MNEELRKKLADLAAVLVTQSVLLDLHLRDKARGGLYLAELRTRLELAEREFLDAVRDAGDWVGVGENVLAIARTIAAIRGIKRWGTVIDLEVELFTTPVPTSERHEKNLGNVVSGNDHDELSEEDNPFTGNLEVLQ